MFLANLMTGLYPKERFWQQFYAVNFMLTGAICIVISVFIGVAVQRIWVALKLNPGLRRNERIMWALFFMFSTFGSLYLVSMVFYMLMYHDIRY